MFDVVTIGGATRDIFFNTSQGELIESKDGAELLAFEYGAKIIPEQVSFCYGGGAVNTAISFSRLGLKTASLINLGKEGTGSLIQQKLIKENVDISLLTRDASAHTALSIIITKGKDHTMFLYRDANENLRVMDWSFVKTKWIYTSSLTGGSAVILKELVSFLEENETNFAWNPGSEQINLGAENFKELLKLTTVLLLNKQEAKDFLRTETEDEKELTEGLKNFGPKVVVVTDGSNGSYCFDGSSHYYANSVATKTVETTGAGDSYGSTFVACQIMGTDIKSSMEIAAKNAASVVQFIGAEKGLLKKEELFNQLEIQHGNKPQ